MNSKSITKYAVGALIFFFLASLITLYSIYRAGSSTLVDYLMYALGYASFLLASLYLVVKRSEFSFMSDIVIGSVFTFLMFLGVTLVSVPIFNTFRNNIFIFSGIYLVGMALTSFVASSLALALKDRIILGFTGFFIIEQPVEKFFNWGEWFRYLGGGKGVLLNNSFLPPFSILLEILMITAVLIYLSRYFMKTSGQEGSSQS